MKRSIKLKISILFVMFSLILCLALSIFSTLRAWDSYTDIFAENARKIAEMTAEMVDGNQIGKYLEGYAKDAYYDELHDLLNSIKRDLDLMYLYVAKPESDRFTVIIEAQLESDDPALINQLGDVFEYTPMEYKYFLPDAEAQRSSTHKIIYYDAYGYGNLVIAWAPVFSDDGEMTGMVGVDIALVQVQEKLVSFMGITIFLFCGITVLLVSCLLFIMHQMISMPLEKMIKNARDFASGGSLSSIDIISTGDEMQTLSEAFAMMADDIELYIKNLSVVTAEKERIGAELDVATKIQASMLPCIFPAFPERPEFDIYASMQPAKEVGGDFYDFFLVDANTLAVVMADVSGKGVPAALFMVIAKTLIKNNAQYGKSPKEVLETVNNLLCENNEASMFVTVFLGYLDIPSGLFTYVNAGHNYPLLKSENSFDWLKTKPGFILAGMDDALYKQHEITLKPGDVLFMYTDGVTEAVNNEYELFSDPRLLETANNYLNMPPKEFTLSIKREIDKFAEGAEQADDITMLVMRISGGTE